MTPRAYIENFERNYLDALMDGCTCEPPILVVYLLQGAALPENIKTWVMQQHPIAVKDYQTFKTMCQSFSSWNSDGNETSNEDETVAKTTWSWA
jgi:hypothetical protein